MIVKIVVVIVLVGIFAGVGEHIISLRIPDINVQVDFPEKGENGGGYGYLVGSGFRGNSTKFSNLEIHRVRIKKGVNVAISGLEMDESPFWEVRYDGNEAVIAEGKDPDAWANWVALYFDATPETSISYTMNDMEMTIRFYYDGYLINRTVNTTATIRVPVPMFTEHFLSAVYSGYWEANNSNWREWDLYWMPPSNESP